MRKRTTSSSDEDSLPTSHPNEHENIRRFLNTLDTHGMNCNFLLNKLQQLKEGKELWVQFLTICSAATLTYGYTNSDIIGARANVQIAIMTVITLVGATPFTSTHLIPATIGVFTGGHNIIGSKLTEDDDVEVIYRNYVWLQLQLLCLVVTLVWRFGMQKHKILDGYSGRLGTTVFIGMNVSMLLIAPLGAVSWDRYYYGLIKVLNSAEDSIPLSRAWVEEAELALGYVVAVLFLGTVAGGTRVVNQRYIKKLEDASEESTQLPRPLNNIAVPVVWALLSMLTVIVSGYRNGPVLFNGFAVGSYVAMSSLQKIPSVGKFAFVSILAAGWGLLLTPFFVGFPGKSGCTAMLGHASCSLFELARETLRARRKAREQQQHLAASQSYDDEFSDQDDCEDTPDSPRIDHHFKPKTEYSVITKHQRRQQRKLKHLQNISPADNDATDDPPVLHHRAWSAKVEEVEDGAWRHSLKSRQEWNSLV